MDIKYEKERRVRIISLANNIFFLSIFVFENTKLALEKGSKYFASIFQIDQSQYYFEIHITHSNILIGLFELCEPRISIPA